MKRAVALASLLLSACATAQMHTEDQLNGVAQACGLSFGDVMQDDSEKRLLMLIHQDPTPEQRACVVKWARKNGLRPSSST